jgi:glucans biosynthesis protein C
MRNAPQRHYGMDWLRIGAFGLLILYHIGMVFVPWGWHVKSPVIFDWLTIPMLGTNSWRLPLLFVVSGFAGRMLIERTSNVFWFIRERSARLLVPVLFGIIIVIPVQPWIELSTQHGYSHGFVWFWLNDYFRFSTIDGIVVPTWQHLWFVVYIWAYMIALPLFVQAIRLRCQPVFDRIFGNANILILPIAWALIVALWLAPSEDSNHRLIGDTVGHLTYLPAFLFGVGLGGSRAAMLAAARYWKPAFALAAVAFAISSCILLLADGNRFVSLNGAISHRDLLPICRSVTGWSMIVALIGIAETFWNHDHRWRPILTEAVFPFYIIHQTIIVVAAWWALSWSVGPQAVFLITLLTTVAGCVGFYLIGRSATMLRPLIGLRSN